MIEPIYWPSLVLLHAYEYFQSAFIHLFSHHFNSFHSSATDESPDVSVIYRESIFSHVSICASIQSFNHPQIFSATVLIHKSPIVSIYPPLHHLSKSIQLIHWSLSLQPFMNSFHPYFSHLSIHACILFCIATPLICLFNTYHLHTHCILTIIFYRKHSSSKKIPVSPHR